MKDTDFNIFMKDITVDNFKTYLVNANLFTKEELIFYDGIDLFKEAVKRISIKRMVILTIRDYSNGGSRLLHKNTLIELNNIMHLSRNIGALLKW